MPVQKNVWNLIEYTTYMNVFDIETVLKLNLINIELFCYLIV